MYLSTFALPWRPFWILPYHIHSVTPIQRTSMYYLQTINNGPKPSLFMYGAHHLAPCRMRVACHGACFSNPADCPGIRITDGASLPLAHERMKCTVFGVHLGCRSK